MMIGHNSVVLNKQVTIMKNFFNNLKSIFNLFSDKKEVIKCNYSNDYYGDQYCQASHK